MLAPKFAFLSRPRATRSAAPLTRRAAALAAILLLGSCSDGAVRGSTVVRMYDNAYGAAITRIAVGDRVHFDNYGRNDHNVVVAESPNAPFPKEPPHVGPGASQELAFDKKGIYQYYCSFHGTPDGRGMAGIIVVGDTTYAPPGKGKAEATATASGAVKLVPKQYATIQSAVDAAAPGDLVLVDSGSYKEEVTVTTPSITIRGTDRNAVIIDGEFVRGNGIAVMADGVALENMTARNAVLNGFFWTGVKGYRGSYLTAYNNGDYGIYSFGATDGVFEESYASGSPDAGFYIGQCYPCRAIVRHVTAEHNALGYSGTNSGGELYLISSIWKNNRSGIVPSSLDSELDPPQRETFIVGNYIADNNNRATPAGGLTPLGLGNGVILAGGVRDVVRRNVIINHDAHGVLVSPLYDLHFWPAIDNTITANFIATSGRGDIGIGGPLTRGTCIGGNNLEHTAPAGLQREDRPAAPCQQLSWWKQQGLAVPLMLAIRQYRAPHITWPDYKKQPVPGPQPNMPDARTAPARPAVDVFAEARLNIDTVALPAEAVARRAAVMKARGDGDLATAVADTVQHPAQRSNTAVVLLIMEALGVLSIALVAVRGGKIPREKRRKVLLIAVAAMLLWWTGALVIDVARYVGF